MPFISSVRGSFGAQGKVGITGPRLVIFNSTTYNLNTQSLTFSSAGEYSITTLMPIPFRASVFGAGGGGAQRGGWSEGYVGGSGGYASGTLILPPGDHKIIVGEGGGGNSPRTTIGGGSSSQAISSPSDNRYSACGGGFSGIFTGSGTVHNSGHRENNTTYRTSGVQARAVLIAGGGGGGGTRTSGTNNEGGHGGGLEGTGGTSSGSVDTLSRGTQTAGGSARPNEWGNVYPATFMHGGTGGDQGYGGGGGGGYFGGSNSNSALGGVMGGGGGGSGFAHPSFVANPNFITGSSQTSPGGVSQAGYISGSGRGGDPSGNTNNSWSGGTGGSGIVILSAS